MVRRLLVTWFLAPLACWANESSCDRSHAPVSDWVKDLAGRSDSVFYGTVTYVEPPLLGSGERLDIWTISVLESYKGSFNGGRVLPAKKGWGILPGESAVFFLDSAGRLLPCSAYQHYLSDFGVINEVRHALRDGT